MIGDDRPVWRATQRFVLVVGAGALGAAVCSTGVRYAGPDDDESLRALRTGAAPAHSGRAISPAEAAALTVLRRAAAAEAATTYEGQKVYSSWSTSGGESVLADVGHVPGRGTWLRLVSASGRSGGRAEVADGGGGDLAPQALSLLTDRYTLRIAEPGRCIGRPATVVEARPVGDDQVAGRFWVDDKSGLLLRRELYDESGRAVRSTVFLDLRVDAATAEPRQTLPTTYRQEPAKPLSPGSSPGKGRPLDDDELDALREDGWVLPGVLPAGLVLYRTRAVEVDGGDAYHLTYSDGLFTLSLFAQRGRLDTSELHGFTPTRVGGAAVHARTGLYRQLVWASGDTVYTLVADAPDSELAQVVEVLPHDKPGAGLRGRVGKGIDRMGSWINPFA